LIEKKDSAFKVNQEHLQGVLRKNPDKCQCVDKIALK